MTAKLIEIVYEGRQGDKGIRKPKELLKVKPLFYIRYGGNKAYRVKGVKCQVYVDNNDIWIRHGMWAYSNGVAWIKMNNLLSYKPSMMLYVSWTSLSYLKIQILFLNMKCQVVAINNKKDIGVL